MRARYATSLSDPDTGSVFWFALAAAQWKTGRLLPEVKDRALAEIESGADLRQWREGNPLGLQRRKRALDNLAVQLRAAPPPPKRIRAPFRPETRHGVCTGLVLLHVRFRDDLDAQTARAVLTGYRNRYSLIADAVVEANSEWHDSALERMPILSLLTEPVLVLADQLSK